MKSALVCIQVDFFSTTKMTTEDVASREAKQMYGINIEYIKNVTKDSKYLVS